MAKITIGNTIASIPSKIAAAVLTVGTDGTGFIELTDEVKSFLDECNVEHGCINLFIRHTSASLTIQENADPDVLKDLLTALNRLAPTDGGWIHDAEGPDDMPAHIKTMLTSTNLQIPILNGSMALGTWQGIYLIEHRTSSHTREVVVQIVGT